ncbi:Rab-GTPase-TBC domain-containing protein [Hamiltosporidium tvaerminnensis]|uniref:Rab-GTPase-TBC domain-containing protein n=2 Tax=Hamiltosporidium tvaerminnensis TaxID=1176355 RepID=A0A4Q9M198_9MICR|nr:Rab-GTPase-TBC domain-containing protein [Hamiltosporidium tvaerminnensis]
MKKILDDKIIVKTSCKYKKNMTDITIYVDKIIISGVNFYKVIKLYLISDIRNIESTDIEILTFTDEKYTFSDFKRINLIYYFLVRAIKYDYEIRFGINILKNESDNCIMEFNIFNLKEYLIEKYRLIIKNEIITSFQVKYEDYSGRIYLFNNYLIFDCKKGIVIRLFQIKEVEIEKCITDDMLDYIVLKINLVFGGIHEFIMKENKHFLDSLFNLISENKKYTNIFTDEVNKLYQHKKNNDFEGFGTKYTFNKDYEPKNYNKRIFSNIIDIYNINNYELPEIEVPCELKGFFWILNMALDYKVIQNEFYYDLKNKIGDLKISKQINDDIHRTFSDNSCYRNIENVENLRQILETYNVYKPDVGYFQCMNVYVGTFRIFVNEEMTFWLLNYFIENVFNECYEKEMEGIYIYEIIINLFIEKYFPGLYKNLEKRNISISSVLSLWCISMFVQHLHFLQFLRIIDEIATKGRLFIFKFCLSLIKNIYVKLNRSKDINDAIFYFKEYFEKIKEDFNRGNNISFENILSSSNKEYNFEVEEFILFKSKAFIKYRDNCIREVFSDLSKKEKNMFLSKKEISLIYSKLNNLKNLNSENISHIFKLNKEIVEKYFSNENLTFIQFLYKINLLMNEITLTIDLHLKEEISCLLSQILNEDQ